MSAAHNGDDLVVDRTQNPVNVQIKGNWVIARYAHLSAVIKQASLEPSAAYCLDPDALVDIDTAGVQLLIKAVGAENVHQLTEHAKLGEAQRKLIRTVLQACSSIDPAAEKARGDLTDVLELVGHKSVLIWQQQIALLNFLGLILYTLAKTFWRPSRWRTNSLVAHIEYTGLNAVPIVALLTFMVGAVVAFLGATVLEEFGATIYTVNLVGFSFLREFGVLLSAILLAGRTASAFTAQLGSMKANEEIDAIRSLRLSPTELLVLPRVLAMVISLPILTFIAMLCGILGGLVVSALALDISPTLFVHILSREIGISHFWVGMVKAPVFAFVIATIGCLEGFKVRGSAQSVGEHTTSSVVQCIFMVILLDALFALFFMEIGW